MTRVHRATAALATVVAVSAGWVSAARACSCLPPKPPIAAASESTVVFEGRTRPPSPAGNQLKYAFEVLRVFKGQVGASVELYTAQHAAACGRRFKPDTAYLVYARTGSNDLLYDGLCSRTRTSARATEDFAALGVGRSHAVPDAPAPAVDDAPSVEPPRIESAGPPAQTPPTAKKGCRAGELPHGHRELWLAGIVLLAVAGPRRRILR